MRRYDDAIADFSRAIELDPDLSVIVGSYLAQLSRDRAGAETVEQEQDIS